MKCKACEGGGRASNGNMCWPCRGSGVMPPEHWMVIVDLSIRVRDVHGVSVAGRLQGFRGQTIEDVFEDALAWKKRNPDFFEVAKKANRRPKLKKKPQRPKLTKKRPPTLKKAKR